MRRAGSRPAAFALVAAVAAVAARAEDPALEALVGRALAQAPALARAAAQVEAGEARVDAAKSGYRPDLRLLERWSSTDSPVGAFSARLMQGRLTPEVMADINNPDPVEDFASTLVLRQTLVDTGARRARLRSARADADRLRRLEEAARRDVRFQVVEAYHGVVRSRAEIALWESTVRLFEGHEALTRARHEEGAALKSDLLSVTVRLDDARESLVAARRGASIALARLARAVGGPVAPEDVPEAPLASVEHLLAEEAVVVAARTTHPLVRSLDSAVEAAGQAVRAAVRSGGPALVAEASGEWHGDDESFGLDRGSYSAALLLDVPIYDAGLWRAQRDEARAERLEAEAARRETADALELAARTAHHHALEAAERIGIARGSVEAAAAALALVEERYRAGLAPVVDLLEAERALTEARLRELEARAAALVAVAAVENLAGSQEVEG